MEAEAIKEGFQMSMAMYCMRYTRFTGDSDASVLEAISSSGPYGNIPVEKVKCYNHLLRNYCNKLKKLSMKSSQRNPKLIKLRRLIGGSVLRLRFGISKAVDHHRENNGSILELQKDILNAPYHVFGEHSKCSSYFCELKKNEEKNKKNEKNHVPDLRKYGLFQEILLCPHNN